MTHENGGIRSMAEGSFDSSLDKLIRLSNQFHAPTFFFSSVMNLAGIFLVNYGRLNYGWTSNPVVYGGFSFAIGLAGYATIFVFPLMGFYTVVIGLKLFKNHIDKNEADTMKRLASRHFFGLLLPIRYRNRETRERLSSAAADENKNLSDLPSAAVAKQETTKNNNR